MHARHPDPGPSAPALALVTRPSTELPEPEWVVRFGGEWDTVHRQGYCWAEAFDSNDGTLVDAEDGRTAPGELDTALVALLRQLEQATGQRLTSADS